MNKHPISRAAILAASIAATFGPSAVAGDAQFPRGHVHAGEQLDAAAFGPGYVETMEAAIARHRSTPLDQIIHRNVARDRRGEWVVPSRGGTFFAHSGEHYITNKWGDPSMGIAFPFEVTVHGVYVAGQARQGAWTKGIRAVGYNGNEVVGTTEWFERISDEPAWFEMDLRNVDRLVIQAVPVINGAGWYALDDLKFSIGQGDAIVIDFEDLDYRDVVSGSGHAGLIWERGAGDFQTDQGVHAPMEPVDLVRDEPVEDGGASSGGGGTLPSLDFDFQGVLRGDAGSFSFPPDTCGAVGPNHFVETVNRNFAVYDKDTGQELINILLGAFLPNSNGDPRVAYDQYSGRWIVHVTDFSATATVFLAVSLTDDPTGSWFKTSFLTAQGTDAGKWPDYPTLGLDDEGIYLAAYMVGGSATMTIFALDKAPLIAQNPSLGTVTAFRSLPFEGAIQPAHMYGAAPGAYLVSRQSSTAIRVRRIDGPLTSPTLVELGSASIPSHGGPPDAPSLGSGTPLDTVGDRLMNAVYRDGSIYTAHTIGLGGRAACRWYEIDAESQALVQSGTVADASLYYFFPGICVNSAGDVVMAFSGSNASQFAACYYTGREAGDPPGEMADPALLRQGDAAQNNIDGFGRNRWGDYSLTSLDPDDELTMWTIQEYAHATDIWGTWIGKLTLTPPLLGFSYPNGLPAVVDPDGDLIRFEIIDIGGTHDPGSGAFFYDIGSGFVEGSVNQISGSVYDAIVPASTCGETIAFYFSADTAADVTLTDPSNAPASSYSALSASGFSDIIVDDFETNMGWAAVNLGATSGDWERGVPVNDPAWDYDPVSDSDGSGQCYLTQNENGNTDVDDGAVQLTTPLIDMSPGNITISYDYYLRLTDTGGGVDRILVEISSNGDAGPWTEIARHDTDGGLSWRGHEITQADLDAAGVTLTPNMKLRFTTNDADPQSINESGLDRFAVTRIICDQTNTLPPTDFTVQQGIFDSGGLAELAESDDAYLRVLQRAPVQPALPLVGVEVEAVSPILAPSQLDFTLEASASAVPANVPQRLELFDFDAGSYDLVDSRIATTTDSSFTVSFTTNPGRFVDGSGDVVARMRWFDPGSVVFVGWAVTIDQAIWEVFP